MSFENARLQRTCEDERRMARKFGRRRTDRLMVRLSALESADSLEELRHAPGHYHELTANWAGHLSADLEQPYRLIFRPTADPPPIDDHGRLRWDRVTAVTIVTIDDTH